MESRKAKKGVFIMTLGQNLRKFRKTKKLSQKQMAVLLKTGQSTVSAWERDEKVPLCTSIIELSKIFRTTTDYLLGLSSNSCLNLAEENLNITELEKNILKAFRTLSSNEQVMICRMLNLEHPAEKLAKIKKA